MVAQILLILLCLGILSAVNGGYTEPYPYGYYAPRPYVYAYPRSSSLSRGEMRDICTQELEKGGRSNRATFPSAFD
jgi:hypothetical protein